MLKLILQVTDPTIDATDIGVMVNGRLYHLTSILTIAMTREETSGGTIIHSTPDGDDSGPKHVWCRCKPVPDSDTLVNRRDTTPHKET